VLNTILLVLGCIIVTVVVVVFWCALVLGARCDAQQEALHRLLGIRKEEEEDHADH
jgi:sensor domain CHASE-containing protein